ncbi:MAG: ABC transporter substrate-binding protein [Propionibacteriaceae bacterium]|jgi:peptide/nickel transport system substrate-binding protein|nr:ABC transporter substrate-binding protein [Propionibacteriaceae bacterium]
MAWVGRASLIALALGLALSACGRTPEPEPDPTTTPQTTALGPVSGINQTDRDRIDGGGDLRLAVTAWPSQWNPWAQTSDQSTDWLLDPLRSRLFDITASGGLQPNPDWLTQPPTVTTDPDTVVIYHLNPAVRWGDGQPVGLVDFQATWQACAGGDPARRCLSQYGFDRILTIEAGPEPGDVQITYSGSYPAWPLTFLHGPARAESVATAEAFNHGWSDPAAQPGWWAGPFTAVATDLEAGRLELVPNSQWWGAEPLLDRLTFVRLDSDQLVEAFDRQEIDAWPLGLEPSLHVAADRHENVQIRRAPSLTWRALSLAQTDSPLADRRVRQAILAGLDRGLVGQAALAGLEWTVETIGNLAWQPGQARYSDLTESSGLGLNLERAQAVLDQAGWTLGPDGLRRRNGQPLSLRLGRSANDPAGEAEALQIAAQLARLGVTVELAVEPGEASALIRSGAFDLVLLAWSNSIYPADALAAWFTTGAASNPTGYSSQTVDSLLASAAVVMDPDTRATLLGSAVNILWRDVALLPLYAVPETWAALPRLANLGPTGWATLRWEDVGFTS